MRTTNNKRILEDVLRYIKIHNKDGMLKESVMTIGKALGYSNASIHRALTALELKGMIIIKHTEPRSRPNTIFYVGPDDEDMQSLMIRAGRAMDGLQKAVAECNEVMKQIQLSVELMERSESYIEL